MQQTTLPDLEIALQPGATVMDDGVRYAVWAPERSAVQVHLLGGAGELLRSVPLTRQEEGFFVGHDDAGKAGDLYKYRIEKLDPFPDPASRFQPQGVHGPSQVVDSTTFPWSDDGWQRPAFRDLVIYELHVGTFTPAGTFRGAIEKLGYLRDLGVKAIEIMPVADFPGERGWGYDGVQLFAPAHCYGAPEDLRALVDAAHAHGLAVILDVVYNHFGPAGNYITQYSPYYFSHEDKTPWGDAINFGHHHSPAVRAFYRANVLYWMREFHMDGFRLDATHAIIDASPQHILAELAGVVHERGGYIIAEDERNEAQIVAPLGQDGFGFDGVWADDFHHIVEVGLIESSVYRHDFTGELQELVTALEQGWFYTGQKTRKRGLPRGTPSQEIEQEHFVFCISNHDQVGNRALGERLSHLVSPPAYRAASALLLLSPYTPLLFQGQEWACSAPFQYFTDHEEELGKLVEAGRREEFKDAFTDTSAQVPSPQAESTFLRSKLNWEEQAEGGCGQTLALYRELLKLRGEYSALRPERRGTVRFSHLDGGVLTFRAADEQGELLLLCDLSGGHKSALAHPFCQLLEGQSWELLLSTNEARFGGRGPAVQAKGIELTEPELLVFRAR